MTQKQFKQRYKPWISNEILDKISEKAKLFNKYIKCKNVSNKNELYNKYKLLKNEITFLTRDRKKSYYQRYFAENKKNLQKVWKGIKQLVNIKSKNFDTPNCVEFGGKYITDPVSVSNSFNDYFTSVANDILSKRKYNGNKSFRDFLSNRLLENFIFNDCDATEIAKIISKFTHQNPPVPTVYPYLL